MDALLTAIESLLSPVIGAANRVLRDYFLTYALLAAGRYLSLRLGVGEGARFGRTP